MAKENPLIKPNELVPRPDPTTLTTNQLFREVGNLREVIETRLNAMDKALELLQKRADRIPSEMDIAISQLKNLHEEKFRSVEKQILELADRARVASSESKDAITTALKAAEKAVEAAFQAAKERVAEQNKSFSEATAKSETSTGKQIDAIGAMISTTVTALNDKIDSSGAVINATVSALSATVNDIKLRMSSMEGSGKGSKDLTTTLFTMASIGIAVIAAIIAFMKLT